ncbi:MAG: peptidase MA family metallohydrolase [Polyangiaceae bacterium]
MSSRRYGWMARVLFSILAMLLAFGTPRLATAEETVESAPGDAPLVVEPHAVVVPSVPEEFDRRDLGWLKISYPKVLSERAEPILKSAEAVRAKLKTDLGQDVLANVEVRIARTPDEMASLAPVGLPPPSYASGVAYPGLDLVLLTVRGPDAASPPDLEEVFRHELAHVALEDATAGRHVPRWFNEGLAVHESGESGFARMKTLWDATLSDTILPLSELDRGFPNDRFEVNIAYAQSADFVRFLLRKSDHARFVAFIERVKNGQMFDRALADAYGSDLRKLEFQWHQELDGRFSTLPMITGGSLLWVLSMVVLVAAYVKRRRRAKATLARWEREEALMDELMAERRRVAESTTNATTPESHVIQASRSLPMIEHDGDWHTLH